MLESYDMPMLDYPSDLDIQMHPSSSDQWFQDEAEMEEDGPLKVSENYSHTKPMKTDSYTQEKPIEVDMEPSAEHQNVEYDMLDDDEIQQSGAELLDVEVYDVSLAHSPAMVTFDITHEQLSNTVDSFENADPERAGLPTTLSDSRVESLKPQVLESTTGDTTTLAVEDEALIYENPFEATEAAVETPELSDPIHVQESEVDHLNHHEIHPQQHTTGTETTILPAEDQPTELVEHLHTLEPQEGHDQIDSRDDAATDHLAQDQVREDQTEVEALSTSANASGDPHEISEGVYIDPPPPVLLSISSEDQYDFSFFNESSDWNTSSGADSASHPTDRVVLHRHPTLYYEPLSTVFDALRQEDLLQSMFQMAESEFILEAVDLQLTISEDNIYARDVTLHDLNVLHDVSGISGLLRMRLYASAPRFITRYQYLQEQVSRFNLELPSGEVPAEAIPDLEISHEEPQEAETLYVAEPVDGAPDQSSNTAGTPSYPNEPVNKVNVHHDEALPEALATESYDEASDLPPLPADTLEEEDTGDQADEEDNDIQKLNLLSTENYIILSDRSSTPEGETQAVDSLLNSHAESDNGETIALEALEALNDEESYTEEQHADTSHNFQEDPAYEEVAGDYDEEETHTAEEQADEKFDTYSTVEGPEGIDSTSLVETGDVASVELGFNDDIHVNNLEREEDPYSNQKIDEPVEVAVASEESSNIENEVNLGHDADPSLESAANPVAFEDDWEEDLDGEGEIDTTWDDDNEKALSNHSSVTLSSKASKRSFDEFESGDGYDDGGGDAHWTPPSSPDPKRSRTQ